ncbi:hypothetical protein GCM10009740_14100 [Terrabacter terrae]|uniref:Uncharacterized protein n=1 Tax=Terrabacter terrae TaxID=318434 RepID=A0ABN2U006_9MICO
MQNGPPRLRSVDEHAEVAAALVDPKLRQALLVEAQQAGTVWVAGRQLDLSEPLESLVWETLLRTTERLVTDGPATPHVPDGRR